MPDVRSVLDHHLRSIGAKDVDEIVADYADDAVIITAQGTFEGPGAIRGFFEGMMGMLTPEFLAAFDVNTQVTNGDYAYISWTVGDAVPLGSDTFHIVDGKIRMQTLALYAAE